MWRVPVGQQEIHEHEALGGGHGRRLYCRLTSLSRSLQTILRINLDGTLHAEKAALLRRKNAFGRTTAFLAPPIPGQK